MKELLAIFVFIALLGVVVSYAPYWILDDYSIELLQQKGFLK